jgi:hypothetical protein
VVFQEPPEPGSTASRIFVRGSRPRPTPKISKGEGREKGGGGRRREERREEEGGERRREEVM